MLNTEKHKYVYRIINNNKYPADFLFIRKVETIYSEGKFYFNIYIILSNRFNFKTIVKM